MTPADLSKEELKKRVLWVPCRSKEALWLWVKTFLDIELPDCTVDPQSNTNPTDMLWEVYSRVQAGDTEFIRILMTSARDGGKTLLASIMELLMVLHMKRDVAHSASIESQSRVAMRYIKTYARNPFFAPYISQMNERRIEFTRYEGEGEVLPEAEWQALSEDRRLLYIKGTNFIQIVITTMRGANSLHAEFVVLDEAELADPRAVEEAKMIPTQTRDGLPPVTLITSSRKFAFGMVQQELDAAERTNLHYRHWNLIDVSRSCPPTRHLPQEPKIPIYVNDAELEAISEKDWSVLEPERQTRFEKKDGYKGCLKNCKIFAACRGLLATQQKSSVPFLKNIPHVQGLFRSVTTEVARSQLLCYKPSSAGLIYPYLDREKHVILPYVVAKKIVGEDFDQNFSYQSLIGLMKSRDGRWVAGIDFGYTHNFAVVLFYVDGNRAFVMGSWSQPELDPAEKLELLNRTIKSFDPRIYADTEAPDMIKFLRKHKFRCSDWSKGPGSVLFGIETVRFKLSPGLDSEPQLFFVDGAPGISSLFDILRLYHWAIGPDGKPGDQPDEVIGRNAEGEEIVDDCADAFRYAVMNTFGRSGKISVSRESVGPSIAKAELPAQPTQTQWAKQIMDHVLGPREDELGVEQDQPAESKGKSGGIFWEI